MNRLIQKQKETNYRITDDRVHITCIWGKLLNVDLWSPLPGLVMHNLVI